MEATAVEAKEATGDGGDSGRGKGGDRRRRRQRRGVRRRRQRHTGSLDAKQQTVQGMDDPKMVAMTMYGWRRALEDDRGLTTEVGGGRQAEENVQQDGQGIAEIDVEETWHKSRR